MKSEGYKILIRQPVLLKENALKQVKKNNLRCNRKRINKSLVL